MEWCHLFYVTKAYKVCLYIRSLPRRTVGCMVRSTLRPPYPRREALCSPQTGGWAVPEPVWMPSRRENLWFRASPHEVNEICAPLGYYSAYNSLRIFRDNLGTEMSLRNYHRSKENTSELCRKSKNPRSLVTTGCFTTSGHNCRRWFPRSLWWKKFI